MIHPPPNPQNFEHVALGALVKELSELVTAMKEARKPEYHQVPIADMLPWSVKYYNRKHIYLYSSSTLILVPEDFGNFTLSAGTLTLFPFDQGIRLVTSGQATPVQMLVLATDELLPATGTTTTLLQSTNPGYTVITNGPTGPALSMGATGEVNTGSGGNTTESLSASNTVITRAGRLCRVLVTTTPTTACTFYDSNNTTITGKTVIGYIPANAAQGTVYDFQFPCAFGIYVVMGTAGVLTIGFD